MVESQTMRRLLAFTILAVVVGYAALQSLPLQEATRSDAPHVAKPFEATQSVRARFRDGDAVKVVPAWHENQWVHLMNMGAGTKKFPFEALLRCDACDPIRLMKHGRVWIIRPPGEQRQPRERLLQTLSTVEDQEFEDGSRVALYEMPHLGQVDSLVGSLHNTTIRRRSRSGETKLCPRSGTRVRCGPKAWENPSVETRDVFHSEVSWVLAHPPANQETLVIDWPIKGGRVLLVRAGFTLKAVRKEGGSPVAVTVFFDGVEADRFVLEPHTYALQLRALALPKGGATSVRFEIYADNHEFRQLMLNSDTVENVPSELLSEMSFSSL